MKKFLSALSASVVGMSMVVGVAAADTTCNGNISNTGSGSTNTVTCVDANNTSVSCVNNVVVQSNNKQTSGSGSASSSGNTTSGSATSGSANNSNTTTVNLGASCAPVAGSKTSNFTVKGAAVSNGQVKGSQVTTPATGSVNAGGGAGTKTDSLQVAGLVGSFVALITGAGILVRKRALGL